MKELDPTSQDYKLNRGVLYHRTLRLHDELAQDVITRVATGRGRSVMVPDGEGHATIFPITDQFLAGVSRVVDSLEQDLNRIGAGDFATQIQEDIYSMQHEGGEAHEG